MSPAHPAKEKDRESSGSNQRPDPFKFDKLAVCGITRWLGAACEFDPAEEEGVGAELEIETEFRRRIAGLRRLPRHEKVHALRAAKEIRRMALRALRERRQIARIAKFRTAKEKRPAPG